VLEVSIFPLFLRFFSCILGHFWGYGHFVSHFNCKTINVFLQNWYLFDCAYHIKRQQIYHIAQKPIRQIIDRYTYRTNTWPLISWLGTCLSIKSCEVKLVLLGYRTSAISEMMRSRKCFPHVSKTPTLTYNRENSVIIKNPIILNIIHNVFNLRDAEVVIMYNIGSIEKSGWPQSSYIFCFHFYCIICKSICIFLKQKSLDLFRARKIHYLTIY